MYINKAMVYGNLTRDPELKVLPSGSSVASFGLATNRTYKDKNGEKKEDTEFHNVVAFGKQAEVIAQYVKKGNPLYVDGRIQTRSWDSEGVKKHRTEIVVESFQFGPKTERSAVAEQPESSDLPEIKYPEQEINPEDVPF